jgi:hypothetical protein
MLGRRSRLGLLWTRGAVPGGVAADDLVARKQRIAGWPGNARNAAVSTWGSFLWDHRPRPKALDGFASPNPTQAAPNLKYGKGRSPGARWREPRGSRRR